MAEFNWQCPHCNRATTITDGKVSERDTHLLIPNSIAAVTAKVKFVVCPNPECKKFTFTVGLHQTAGAGSINYAGKLIRSWRLLPEGAAKPFPDYIPKAIRDDYAEACLIIDGSAKASATLSRRCLQGIIRDFWKVKPGNLVHEIDQIKDKTDGVTWAAIDAVRRIGNIGAHMEKDINVIVDVDPDEAQLLISLVETLLTEWYVGRHEREQRMKAIVSAAEGKKISLPPKPEASTAE